MGIQNRDYMRRQPDDDDERDESSVASDLATSLQDFFEKHPRFLTYLGYGGALFLAAAIVVCAIAFKNG